MWKLAAVVALSMTLMGCLFVVDSKQSAGKTQWYEDDLQQIAAGQTSAAWVRETFGTPYRTSARPDGSEVWRYRNSRSKETEIGLFLLFNIDVSNQQEEILALEMQDGIVNRHWVERH